MTPLWYGFINYIGIYICYPIVEIYVMRNYDKFEHYDRKRKNYIIKNIIKSLILKYISIATIPLIPLLFFNMGNITKCLHFLGFLYYQITKLGTALHKVIKPLKNSKKIRFFKTFHSQTQI